MESSRQVNDAWFENPEARVISRMGEEASSLNSASSTSPKPRESELGQPDEEETGVVSGEKRERFRRYLELHGVADFITKGLAAVQNLDHWPDDPIKFLREWMKSLENDPLMYEYTLMVDEKAVMEKDIDQLEQEIRGLEAKLRQLEDHECGCGN